MEGKISIAQKLGITTNRVASISNALFGEGKSESGFTPEQINQIEGVVKVIRYNNERSVNKAVALYKQGVANESRIDPRSHQSPATAATAQNRESGISQVFQSDLETARMIAIKRAVSIQEASHDFLAEYLSNGIPLDAIPVDAIQLLEDSKDKVYDAVLGKMDSVGNYLPALAQQNSLMLSAAIDE